MHKASILEQIVEMMFLMAADWSYIKNTATHLGADFVSDKFIIECKNWNSLFYMRTQQFYDDVLARFLILDPDHTKRWVLVIPKLWAYGDDTIIFDLMDEYSIQLVEIENQYSTPRVNVAEYLFNEIYHQNLQKTVYIPELGKRAVESPNSFLLEHSIDCFPVLDECIERSLGSILSLDS